MLRATRKQELKEQIFMQALKLFDERGFENVTVEQITLACGIAKGTFYNYFPKKESVLLHLGETQLEAVNDSIRRNAGVPDLKDQLMLLFESLFERYDERPDMIRLMLSEMIRSGLFFHEEMSLIQSFRNALVTLLEEAKRNDLLPEQAASEDIAAVLTGVYFNSLLIWLSADPTSERVESIFRRHFDIVWSGIRPEGAEDR